VSEVEKAQPLSDVRRLFEIELCIGMLIVKYLLWPDRSERARNCIPKHRGSASRRGKDNANGHDRVFQSLA
jgi:hypothetical protein